MEGPDKVGGATAQPVWVEMTPKLEEEIKKPRDYCKYFDASGEPAIQIYDIEKEATKKSAARFAGTAIEACNLLGETRQIEINKLRCQVDARGYGRYATNPGYVILKLNDEYAEMYGPFVAVDKRAFNDNRAEYDKIGAPIRTLSAEAEISVPSGSLEERIEKKVGEVIKSPDYADAVASFKITWGEGQQKKVVIEVTFKPHVGDRERPKILSKLRKDISPSIGRMIIFADKRQSALIIVK